MTRSTKVFLPRCWVLLQMSVPLSLLERFRAKSNARHCSKSARIRHHIHRCTHFSHNVTSHFGPTPVLFSLAILEDFANCTAAVMHTIRTCNDEATIHY